MNLIQELGLDSQLKFINSKTGMFFNSRFYKFSKPLDLLSFKPLPFIDRLRLGFLTLYVRRIKNWKKLESLSAVDWLKKIGGKKVFYVVWLPLLKGKFGKFYEEVSAVWFWNKIKLRGGSRDNSGTEKLVYLHGGFKQIEEKLKESICKSSGNIFLNTYIKKIDSNQEKLIVHDQNNREFEFDRILYTGSSIQFAELLDNSFRENRRSSSFISYRNKLKQIRYLGNVCIVLELSKSLSDLYWMNVNDPNFPFVGVIEHTNLISKDLYNNNNIVYLSKYLEIDDEVFSMNEIDLRDLCIKSLKVMFKDFHEDLILEFKVWREKYSQPIVTKNYSEFIPSNTTPVKNLYFSSMCQIYPEDRGTNYAVREGLKISKFIEQEIKKGKE